MAGEQFRGGYPRHRLTEFHTPSATTGGVLRGHTMDVDAEILAAVGSHPITRFLSHTYGKACDHFAYARGPGLKALETIEGEYARLNRHLVERFSFAGLQWWFSQATPHAVQQELQHGFLSDGAAVLLVFGRSRRSLWEWAERDRKAWCTTEFASEMLAKYGLGYDPRACPITDEVTQWTT